MDAAAELSADGVRPDADALVIALFRTEAARLVQLARWFDQDRAAAYLRSIVINLARDHNRRGLVSLRHRLPAEPDDRSAEDHATESESRQAVIAALRALPRRQRDCVVLRYYLELSIADIADTLGLSPNSVKTHLQRGLRALKTDLEVQG